MVGLSLCLAACGSEPEVWQAGIDTAALDLSADPCDDFYRYACGGFLDAHPIPPDGAVVSRSQQAFYAVEDVQRAVLGEPPSGDPDSLALESFHTACLDASDGFQATTALTAVLDRIDAIATPADLARAVFAVQSLGGSALFSFGSTRDLSNPGKRMAYVSDPGLGMPDRSYYLDPASPALPAYREHIAVLSALVGVDDPELADAVVKIETALAAAMLPPDEARDPTKVFNVQERAAFEASVPGFDWAAYREATSAPAYTRLDVTEPAFFEALAKVLKTTPMADLQRYLRWGAIDVMAAAMDDDITAEHTAFHRTFFTGATALSRPEYCLRLTVAALPWSMGREYVKRAFPPAAQAGAEVMASAMRGALDRDLSSAAWLDAPTRGAARAKLAAMNIAVGAPAIWPSIEGLFVDRTSFVNAYAAVTAFNQRKSISRIGADDADPWFMAPATVNASYSPSRNTVNLPAAILQPPFFDPSFAEVVKFGAIGSVMGHELTHGFDDSGRLYDATGKLASFWSKKTEADFQARAQCVVDQYASIEGLPGVPIDGELTLGENIADLGGVKLAYAAAAPSTTDGGALTDAQAFFVAYGQIWCANVRPEYASVLLRTDPHAPYQVRVNAVLSNLPEFARAFSCDTTSNMVAEERCEVW